MTDLEKQNRIKGIKNSLLFRTCSDAILSEIESEFSTITLAKDDVLFQEGEPGDSLYIVNQGRLAVHIRSSDGQQMVIDEKTPGTCVGEIAMLVNQPRTASVFALMESSLLRLSKEGFNHLIDKHPILATILSSSILPNLQTVLLTRIFGDLFGSLDAETLNRLLSEVEWRSLTRGETLFSKGDPGDGMYIVVTGRLQIVPERVRGLEMPNNEIGQGEFVGEMALLTGEVRSETVRAIRDADVVKLRAETYEHLIGQYPKIMTQLMRTIIKRQQLMLNGRSEKKRSYNYVIVPLSKELALDSFLYELIPALGTFGSIMMLDADRFDSIYGVAGASHRSIDDPLHLLMSKCMVDLDSCYQYLVYLAEPDWSNWTQRCLMHADRIILIADANSSPQLREIEVKIQQQYQQSQLELVLIHPAQTRQPAGTAEWLRSRKVSQHHHIRQGESRHIRKLARHLTDNSIGLVLSGGGARGLAHIGVLRALAEAGIEIDLIAGTSMGSLIAACYALHLDHEQLVKLAQRFSNSEQLLDYTLPIVSLMSSKKVSQAMEDMFGDTNIEDLWLQFFCISSNLSRAIPVVHDKGLLRRAVRASIAIPTVFTPVIIDGDVIVDGGLVNNFPVDIMRQLCKSGTVIGVSVAPPDDNEHTYELDDNISGWKVLLNRINPMAEKIKIPSLIWTMLRSMEINNVYLQNANENLTDILLHPDVGKFGMLDFSNYQPIIEIGYQHALPQFKEWKHIYTARYGRH